jgi:hypothetical protein
MPAESAESCPDPDVADDRICAECRASIDENQENLRVERQIREARSALGRKIWRWGRLTVLLILAACVLLVWLLGALTQGPDARTVPGIIPPPPPAIALGTTGAVGDGQANISRAGISLTCRTHLA